MHHLKITKYVTRTGIKTEIQHLNIKSLKIRNSFQI